MRRVLVYDLGGGTFDVSIVQSQDGVVEVLASHGDTALGGDDFDDAFMDFVALKFRQQYGIDLRDNLATKARLLRAVEAAKRSLSDHPFVRIEEEFVAEKDGVPLHLAIEVSRQEFEELIQPWLDRTIECVQRTLDDARLIPSQLDKVVLVGGSTRIPLVTRLLQDRLGLSPHCEVNPDLCVAMGAAIQAGLISGQSVGAVLVDVTPHSLGIRCLDFQANGGFPMPFEHRFVPIIRRNSPLPVNRSEVFATVADEQPEVEIEVFQGENNDVRRNHRVGKFRIEGLAAVPAGNQIVVQLDLNLDGMLKVSAREKATGLQKQITIDNTLRPVGSNGTDFLDHLDELWADSTDGFSRNWESEEESSADTPDTAQAALPELTPAPREGQRETVQARALLEKSDRIRAKVSAEDRQELDRLMECVRVHLHDRNWLALSRASDELTDVLFYLDDA